MYKILSIDGGGIKGVYPISFLASIEDTLSGKIGEYFDLIVGTSTGGIIALGLGLGFSANDLLKFYEELGPEVFVKRENGVKRKTALFKGISKKTDALIDNISYLRQAKYDAEVLKRQVQLKFGERQLGESKTRLVIPSFNIGNGEPHVYKTSHHPRLQMDYRSKVVDVALATSAAPTYFQTHLSENNVPLVDGGVYANNPTGLAVVEAISLLNWKPEDFKVLSVGCTNAPMDFDISKQDKGTIDWATKLKLIEIFMLAQSKQSMGTSYLLANHRENNNIFRIDETVTNGKYGLDSIEFIEELKGMGYARARIEVPELRDVFFDKKASDFIPYHK
ncbi:CBASS cGAMP-activated phospholipase [Lederbergia graminis]|uniref:CBASS cGAMP-activated phospholipase n=1 Tax=Lederbergia graminis TaxID=735518 RepID=A0ABW0LGH3_9BACI